jgi:hypothetical protein
MREVPSEVSSRNDVFIVENQDADCQFALRRLTSSEYRLWKKHVASPSQDTRELALERVTQSCLIWPDWQEFRAKYLDVGFPVLADMLGEWVVKKSGGQTNEAQKKSLSE